ncbi:N-acetylmuramoyl-L-alanine amidase [Mycobacterium heckeshornense]|uniref:N-acetylmuramoyl-L-alanine amidase n=1 Tax=Mycobacterium heckeshornense TaxID=110505 RepID=UPI000662C075|nr:N-acetylmuramoyl-L-alanine amidase [Mycobacterium heckeshornense]KMV23329.1 hypothetical protein ACT16_06530 [Mycobacterium heckeshornense]
MSFTWFAPQPLLTKEQIAWQVHQVSLARGLDELATVIALMTIATEVGANGQWWCPANPTNWPDSTKYPHDSTSDDGRSMGYFQQQPGPNGEPWWGSTEDMMTLSRAADTFLARLTDNWWQAANNPVLAGQFAQQVQQSAYPDRYAQHWDEAWDVLHRALANPAPPQPPPPGGAMPDRPDFNEYPIWSPNNQPRGSTKVDLFLLHTQEGDGNADSLARYLADPASQVSYHYTISTGYPHDDGVTVCDVVDTDLASWSVGDANNRSINLCFAGSSVNWSRDEWLTKAGRAIDVAAYLAVQDCRKYGIPTTILGFGGEYPIHGAGISDHRYVTDVIGWGTHTDVGPNFPKDVFAAAVAKYAGTQQDQPSTDQPETGGTALDALTPDEQHELLDKTRYIYDQLGPGFDSWGVDGDLGRNAQGLRRTLRAGLAALMRKVGA